MVSVGVFCGMIKSDMHLRTHDIVIPLIVVAVALSGGAFTEFGIASGWYESLVKPDWTPPGSVISVAWLTIYVLATFSVLLVWHKFRHAHKFQVIMGLFLVNAVLNILWSYFFFAQHAVFVAMIDAGLIALSVALLIRLTVPNAHIAALLLLPYLGWGIFATYLNYVIWQLNV
jgi:translocator protein